MYLGINSDIIQSSLFLGAFTAALAFAKEPVLVGAVFVEA